MSVDIVVANNTDHGSHGLAGHYSAVVLLNSLLREEHRCNLEDGSKLSFVKSLQVQATYNWLPAP